MVQPSVRSNRRTSRSFMLLTQARCPVLHHHHRQAGLLSAFRVHYQKSLAVAGELVISGRSAEQRFRQSCFDSPVLQVPWGPPSQFFRQPQSGTALFHRPAIERRSHLPPILATCLDAPGTPVCRLYLSHLRNRLPTGHRGKTLLHLHGTSTAQIQRRLFLSLQREYENVITPK